MVGLTEEFLRGLDLEDSMEEAIVPAMSSKPNHPGCTLGRPPRLIMAERVKPEGIMREEDTELEVRCPVEALPENTMP